MSLNDHVRALRDRLLIIVLLAAVGAGLGYWAASNQPPSYQSSSLIALGPKRTVDSSLSSITQALYDRSVPSTLAQVATSASTLDVAANLTGLDAAQLQTDAVVANDSNVVEVVVTGGGPTQTQRFAQMVTSQAMLKFNNLYPIFRTINIGPPALGADNRVSPTVGAIAGGAVGLLIGVLLALALGRRHPALTVVDPRRSKATG